MGKWEFPFSRDARGEVVELAIYHRKNREWVSRIEVFFPRSRM